MPAIDPESGRRYVKPKAKVKRPKTAPPRQADQGDRARARPVVRPSTPDQQDRDRERVARGRSPDQADRERSPEQKKRDAAGVKKSIRTAQQNATVIKKGEKHKPLSGPVSYLPHVEERRRKVQQQRTERLAPVLNVLDQTTRPLHGVAANAKLNVKHIKEHGLKPRPLYLQAPVKESTKASAKGLKNEDKSTFSDVLKEAGVKNKLARGVGGFALDVVADPTTFVTGGTSSAAAHAATSAARKAEQGALRSAPAQVAGNKAAQQAAKHGATPKQAKKAGKAAARTHARRAGKKAGQAAAAGKPANTGLAVRFAGHDIPGVTRATSAAKRGPRAVARKTGAENTRVGKAVDRAQQRVRDVSRNAASDFNPAIAPAGVDRDLYQAGRRSARTGRAGAQRGTYRAGQRAIAFRDAIGKENYSKVIDAIETGTISSLPKALRGPARELERDFARMLKQERRAGLKVGDITQSGRKAEFPTGSTDTGASSKALSKARRAEARAQRDVESARSAADIHQGRAEVLSRNVADRAGEKAAERGRSKRKVKTREVVTGYRVNDPKGGARVFETFEEAKAYQKRAWPNGDTNARHAILEVKGEIAVNPPKYAGGGYGVQQASTAAKDAAQRLRNATAAREAAEKAHEGTKLTAAEYRAAQKLQDKLDAAPPGYVKHLRLKDNVRKGAPSVGSKKVAPSFGKGRMEGTIAEKNLAEPGAYSENIADIYLNRAAESAVARSKAKLNQAMVNAGRKPDRATPIKHQLDDNETLYKVDGADLVKVDPKSAEARTLPKGGRYVILNEKLISRTRGTVASAAERSSAGVFFDRAQGVWKLTATQVNPGYHVRNFAGEMQNAYLAENPITLGRNAVQAARALRQLGRNEDALRVLGAKPKKGKYSDFIDTAESVGAVRAGQLGREVGQMLGGQSAKNSRLKARSHKLFRKPARALKNAEDVFRLATYKGGIDRGLSPEMAMERASRNHFDYGDLTPLERKVLRRAAPFWTFSARNIPLQARTLLTRPGKFANYQKIREELQNAFGVPDGWEQDLAESEQRSAPFPVKINGKTYNIGLGPSGLPLTDLNEFPSMGDPVKQADEWMARAMSMLTPAAKTPVELWSNFSFFFREPIEREGGPLVAAPSWVSAIPEKYRKQLGITKDFRDPRTGKSGWGAPAKLVYAVGVLPGPIAFGNRFATESSRPGQSKAAKTVQYLGPRVRQNDPVTVRINRLYDEKAKVTKRKNALGQQNLPGTTTEISAKTATPEFRKLQLREKQLSQDILRLRLKRGDKGLALPKGRSGSNGRVRVPGVSGRVKVPGSSGGRVKIP